MPTIKEQIVAARKVVADLEAKLATVGSIAVLCFNDADGDGVKDADESGTGVRDVLLKPGNIVIKTNEDGTGIFEDLQPGEYIVDRASFPKGYRNSTGGPAKVTVKAGEVVSVLIGSTNKAVDSQPTPPQVPDTTNPPPKAVTKFGVVALNAYGSAKIAPLIAPLQPKNNRVWINSNNFGKYTGTDSDLNGALECYRLTGAVPIFCVAQEYTTIAMLAGAPAYMKAVVADLIARADKDDATRGMVITVEFMNEPDHTYFENKDVKSYITKGLKPVYDELKKAFGPRVRVLGGNLSWNYKLILQNIDLLKGACDAIGFHGYVKSIGGLAIYDAVQKACAAVGLPVVLTEFGLGYGQVIREALAAGDKKKADYYTSIWADDLAKAYKYIINLGIAEISAFIAVSTGSTNSGQALFTADSKKNLTPTKFFYSIQGALRETGLLAA